ncbi:MAG: thioesterase family protein [Syntrophales bacterium]
MTMNKNIEFLLQTYANQVPFYKLLGFTLDSFDAENVCIRFPWREEFLGNPLTKLMHGGVISAILDTVGGFVLHVHYASCPMFSEKLARISTIDLHVDYLLPGRGCQFIASGNILRIGKKVAVIRTELQNEEQKLIAAATGKYIVG